MPSRGLGLLPATCALISFLPCLVAPRVDVEDRLDLTAKILNEQSTDHGQATGMFAHRRRFAGAMDDTVKVQIGGGEGLANKLLEDSPYAHKYSAGDCLYVRESLMASLIFNCLFAALVLYLLCTARSAPPSSQARNRNMDALDDVLRAIETYKDESIDGPVKLHGDPSTSHFVVIFPGSHAVGLQPELAGNHRLSHLQRWENGSLGWWKSREDFIANCKTGRPCSLGCIPLQQVDCESVRISNDARDWTVSFQDRSAPFFVPRTTTFAFDTETAAVQWFEGFRNVVGLLNSFDPERPGHLSTEVSSAAGTVLAGWHEPGAVSGPRATSQQGPALPFDFGSPGTPEYHIKDAAELRAQSRHRALLTICLTLMSFIGIGVLFCHHRTDLSWSDTIYFITVTVSTVGYGDIFMYLDTPADRLTSAAWVCVNFYLLAAAACAMHFGLENTTQTSHEQCERVLASYESGDSAAAADVLEEEVHTLRLEAACAVIHVLMLLGVGVCGGVVLEGWDLSASIYWVCITVTTVGYGDIVPRTEQGKCFASAFIIASLWVQFNALSLFAQLPFRTHELRNQHKVLAQFGSGLNFAELHAILSDDVLTALRIVEGDTGSHDERLKRVSVAEFIICQLVRIERLDLARDVRPCAYAFRKLDKDLDGSLDVKDVYLALKEQAMRQSVLTVDEGTG
eukprot:TRINITY_DN111772_c0_g1_i1.p1 TRINITY_DN111772_c0_g1~~TRINITY_DN111772_c0_g1_i1.p1  ORF type:complete len:683 (-),score=65.53 TRINITY_DN111772_c0_g1_i1:17-2065(-)